MISHSVSWGRAGRMFAAFAVAGALRVGAAEKPVSYHRDIVPLMKRSCTGCHHPGKLKGELDLTTHAALLKGGKHGPAFKAGEPKASPLWEEITGDEPSMPKEGDPLSKQEVALVERWIQEGATDDTPSGANSFKLSAPPVYHQPPVISSLRYSPDGKLLAVSGYHEVLLHRLDGSGPVVRLVGESPRIESLVFSADGQWLAVSGGAPSQFGEIQVWDVKAGTQAKSFKITADSLYGVSFSPDAKQIAFGCADKTVRVIDAADGRELMKLDNHGDWVFCTTFTVDGKRLLSGSRDKAMKLINVANGQFIDDVNKLLEGVMSFARHPKEDLIAYGGEQGTPRIYRISDNQGRTAANNDVNQIRAFERQPGPVYAIAYSPDGARIATGSVGGEVRVYQTSDGSRVATLKDHGGAVFSLAFNPAGDRVATGGYDGLIREFDPGTGKLLSVFYPLALEPAPAQQAAK